ncbi:MAG: hypothetical protein ACD_66C00246G0002 [uncultured bacterium]|uniref:Uncharacterized protein n=1 Tax=Candidatus Uhrbacteria bacterium GW2011_GWC1_41_20 TaxID=1618983 RepID=A0A0G0YBP3_9BACT|nr:MAG: hypothetical protein ACD_66C00246G0002 [uncultured bacterium]KKR21696.1 MAG: hypothetical protein UT52_C0025G0008 [Candidatus Uhrbacteria bacterium GW2011_GWE1_39_46]KKR63192.1 MAG: hypothetical protein UU04_C0024G0008 [Candidatus Uhrbacteria bacterium GW2011_GWC2_40_450]KKR89518.1 MAG: hypothetical protein UU40_C0023G0008 [Candidatus Uhrbacteria bacterium GW2011_GWD2_41_121]KKR94599.1 MAG: hypothetical protein UU46_C0031G0008 [Candidatus Uhrbacteria bacterium GW2011_GWD1_41_16]KKR9772
MLQYVHMKRLFAFFLIFILFTIFLLPSFTYASCNCWCENNDGAEEKGAVADIATCQSTCDDFLGCYTDEQQSMNPDYNTLCWSQYECESQPVEFAGGTLASEWDGQASFCPAGKGYCYSEPQPIKLNIAIGSLTEAASLGQYINAVYSWLLTGASLLAVVIMMIGGIEYILARGNGAKIGTAQAHLKQAVTGIVLLFCSYAIANVIDPHFTTFNRLQPPRIRTIVFLDESSTCENMINAGLIIAPNPPGFQICGYTGTVIAQGAQQVSVEVGTECTYSACTDEKETCVGSALGDASTATTESGPGYACVRCTEAVEKGATPSTQMCGQLEFDDPNPNDPQHYYCEYDAGFYDKGVFGRQCVEIVYPENEYFSGGSPSNVLDCDLLRADARAGDSESCRYYDNVQVGYYDAVGGYVGGNIDYNEIDDVEGDDSEFPWLDLICDADPCGLAPPGEKCEMVTADPDEAGFLAALGSFGAGVVIGALTDEIFANCTNTSSVQYYGLWGCLDDQGDKVECNPEW